MDVVFVHHDTEEEVLVTYQDPPSFGTLLKDAGGAFFAGVREGDAFLSVCVDGCELCTDHDDDALPLQGGSRVEVGFDLYGYCEARLGGGENFRSFPAWMKHAPACVRAAIAHDPDTFRDVPTTLRAYEDLALAAVAEDAALLEVVPPSLMNKAFFLKVLSVARAADHALQYAPKEMQADAEVVKRAVARDGFSLRYASDTLRDTHAIVAAAVADNPAVLKYASDALRDDAALATECVARHPAAYKHLSPRLQCRAVVEAALSFSPSALQFAPEDMRNDAALLIKSATTAARLKREWEQEEQEEEEEEEGDEGWVKAVRDPTQLSALKHAGVQAMADEGLLHEVVRIFPDDFIWLPTEMQTTKRSRRGSRNIK